MKLTDTDVRMSHYIVVDCKDTLYIRTLCTVLDTNNLHFSDEFLDFPVQADTDIHADVLEFSARFRCNFSQDSARKAGFHRGFMQKKANQQACMYVAMYSAYMYTRNTLPS